MHTIVIIIIIILFLVILSCIEQERLITSNYIVESKKISSELDGTSFVVLADLHNHSFGNNNEKLMKQIELASPDFIIIAGDMPVKSQECVPCVALSLLETLADKYQIYYALGNHEQALELSEINYNYFEYKQRLIDKGVLFLENDSIILNKQSSKLGITGVSIDREYFNHGNIIMKKKYLDTLLNKESENETLYQIMIAHNPVYFKQYIDWGADLTLSGHLHGGLIRLPFLGGVVSPQYRFFPKYDSGKFELNGREMIVSRGLGIHSIMLRLFNRPELVSVKLKRLS